MHEEELPIKCHNYLVDSVIVGAAYFVDVGVASRVKNRAPNIGLGGSSGTRRLLVGLDLSRIA